MKLSIVAIIILLLGQIAFAEEPLFNWNNDEVLVQRLAWQQEAAEKAAPVQESWQPPQFEKKSVKKAVVLSALIPGLGQVYANSYIKAALFLAAEITAWSINITYNKKGDDKDAEFKQFADQHWSERAYWSYVAFKATKEFENPPVSENQFEQFLTGSGGIWFLIKDEYYTPELIAQLRELEGQMPGFSHRLPKTKTQQYYEMIGKYPAQFGNAWDDASFNIHYTGYPPARLTSRNDYYMDMRDEANRFYNIAGYGSMIALVNHVLAALDAGFTTRRYNRKIEGSIQMSYKSLEYKNEYVNMLGVRVNW